MDRNGYTYTYKDILAKDVIVRTARNILEMDLYKRRKLDKKMLVHLIHYLYYDYINCMAHEYQHVEHVTALVDAYCDDILDFRRIGIADEYPTYELFVRGFTEAEETDVFCRTLLASTGREVTEENITKLRTPLTKYWCECYFLLAEHNWDP